MTGDEYHDIDYEDDFKQVEEILNISKKKMLVNNIKNERQQKSTQNV